MSEPSKPPDPGWPPLTLPETVDPEEEERMVAAFKADDAHAIWIWRILARDVRDAFARGELELAEELLGKAEKMKAVEERVAGRSG